MSEFTPGPWIILGDGIYHQRINPDDNPDDIQIAKINQISNFRNNARLIAAAPDMYEILTEIYDDFRNYVIDLDNDIQNRIEIILNIVSNNGE